MKKILGTRDQNGRLRVQEINEKVNKDGEVVVVKSRTQQHMKKQTDVNEIMKKYAGKMSRLPDPIPRFADVSQIPDYHGMMNQVLEARSSFDQLPAQLRLRFQNNPGDLLAFLKDPNNYEEGVRLGLLAKRPEQNEEQNQPDKNSKTGQKTATKQKQDSQTPPPGKADPSDN